MRVAQQRDSARLSELLDERVEAQRDLLHMLATPCVRWRALSNSSRLAPLMTAFFRFFLPAQLAPGLHPTNLLIDGTVEST